MYKMFYFWNSFAVNLNYYACQSFREVLVALLSALVQVWHILVQAVSQQPVVGNFMGSSSTDKIVHKTSMIRSFF